MFEAYEPFVEAKSSVLFGTNGNFQSKEDLKTRDSKEIKIIQMYGQPDHSYSQKLQLTVPETSI